MRSMLGTTSRSIPAPRRRMPSARSSTLSQRMACYKIGGGVRVLQPTIRQGYSQVGREGIQRNEEAEHKGCDAYTCENGYELLAQVDIPSRNAYRLC